MRFTRSTTLLALAAVIAACADNATLTAPPAAAGAPSAIYNGYPATSSTFASVGALMYDFNADGVINGDDEDCTGSLISPTVFLTAAHCVEFLPSNAQLYVSFAPDLYAKGITVIKATGFTFDPGYGHDNADLHDMAVVFLPAKATKGMATFNLPTAGYLDALSAKGALASAQFYNVGYGTGNTATGVPGFPYDGTKKYSVSEFSALEPNWLQLLMNTNATGGGGDCYGDSGGPKMLVSDPTTIVATVTTGDYVCRATTKDYRLDTPSARAFLGQFVTLR
ncbi:MAG: trypsin-like serine protease [Gemmatimonadaceae bacterium]|nr:trypsin-like serine protease [Gemmatimonadaceae bacterium]NUQ91422.1 trypsin-like serine protease [Gemmatimonadaceae bacterium]NUR20981.1 trypsin-like serine protease [Gemmatimonadaceae bacterium]NUS97210.1 trypsin-like serine protease [Gemmatimonadaceae bacterium]